MDNNTVKTEITWEEKTTLEFLKKKNLLLSELLNEINDYYSIYDSINNTKNLEELEKIISENSDKWSKENTKNDVKINSTNKKEISEKANFNDNNTTYSNNDNDEVIIVPKIRLNLKKV